jgi:stage II sporulation protein D
MPVRDTDPPLVRVLLERSTSVVKLPQPGRAYWVRHDGTGSWLWGPIEIRVAAAGTKYWQVGAWSDPANAAAAAQKIRRGFGAHMDVRQEAAANGLTRVRVGWTANAPEDPVAELAALGFPGAFSSRAAGVLRITGADNGLVTSAAEVVIEPAGDWPVAVGSRRYRGRLRARAGVVPVEMGPSQFPELDALKAQAVAARTYAVAHLGDHADEGWDLCDTPACQVYAGAGAEHRLSDRAVAETAGLVAVYEGEPIDAMYTSTCGGHTENAAELFSGAERPYLAGVPCVWDRPLLLTGTLGDGDWIGQTAFSAAVAREVLGVAPGADPVEILARVEGSAGVTAGLPTPVDADSFAYSLLAAVGVDPPSGIAPTASGLGRLLFLTDLYKAPLDPPTGGLGGDWPAAAALAALELRGDVVRDRGEAVPRIGAVGIFPRRAERAEDLPSPLPLWERWRGGYRRIAAGEVLPGTTLERVRAADEVLALVVVRSGGDAEADRRSAWREWARERSWSELERMLGMSDLERLQVTARSPSGRVVGLLATGRSGARKEWKGFEVRQVLGLPETLFGMHLRTTPDGERMVRFLGRGWGHGVGLCQNGAYGLARAGQGFEQILGHYYTGIQIVRWSGATDDVESTGQ